MQVCATGTEKKTYSGVLVIRHIRPKYNFGYFIESIHI